MRLKPLAALALLGAAALAAAPINDANLNPKTDAPGLKVGDHAPTGLTLRTVDGKETPVDSLWADGPVVVTFYRGGWCPYCTKELAKWEPKLSEVDAMGAEFVAITMEKPDAAQKTTAKHAADMRVLSDMDGDVSRAFRLAFALDDATTAKYKGYGIDLASNNANAKWELPAPGTYVIDEKGVIRYAWADWDYTKRAPVDEVMKAVREVASAAH